MSIFSKLGAEIRYLSTARKMLAAVKSIDSDSPVLATDDIEAMCDKYPDNIAFIEDDRTWSYTEFDNYANQVAHWAKSQGCKRGDTVAVFARNRLEYVALWYGLSKIGAIAALLNFHLRGKALAHCIEIAECKIAIIDRELAASWRSAQKHLPKPIPSFSAFGSAKGFEDFDESLASQHQMRPDKSARIGIIGRDLLMKMFTSGTTGLPKAAKVAHTRAQLYMRGFMVPASATAQDRVMMVMPLYHATGGLCGVGMALMRGGGVIVRPKFSASGFWKECKHYEASIIMYVGELCRFLLSQPQSEVDTDHNVRCIVGNGLAKDVWIDFVERFKINTVVEFYGATEGNISLINTGGPAGAVGRIPPYLSKKLNGDIIRFDTENNTHPKGPDGFMQRTKPGEIGELIGEIRAGESRFKYDGYADKSATDKKVLHDVFKKGDLWFRTGDLMWRDAQHWYYFSDRIGDTFRWMAENVSTGEVAAALTAFGGISQANVYGVEVPGYDGRAGMASLVAEPGLDLAALHAHLSDALPRYARPVFLRISEETETTSTFKYKKTNLVKQGYNPEKISDRLYVATANKQTYVPLSAAMYKKVLAKGLKF